MGVLSEFTRIVGWSGFNRYRVLPVFKGRFRSLLVALCGSALALQSAVAGGISGQVSTEVGETPLQGITVWACRSTGSGSWEWTKSVSTDAAGDYIIEELLEGTYRVVFRDWNSGYVGEIYNDIVGTSPWYGGTDITVPADSTVSNINAALVMGSAITGQVTAEAGGANLPNISVTAYRANGSSWDYAAQDSTDSAGTFQIEGLIAGTYRVVFQDWNSGYVSEVYDNVVGTDPWYGGTDITVLADSTVSNINAALAMGSTITGQVTAEAGGTNLPNISVTAYRANGSSWDWISQQSTDSTGTYQISGLIAGTYRVVFQDGNSGYVGEIYNDIVGTSPWDGGTDITVLADSTVSNINAALAMGSTIVGQVTAEAEGTHLPNIAVTAYRANGLYWDWISQQSTDVTGNYEISGLAPGTYRVQFSDYMTYVYIGETYDGLLDIGPYDGGTEIDVLGGGITVSNINASLQTYVSISGTATDAGSGQPVQGVWVYLHGTWRSAVTDSAGNYTISRILPGTYYLRANPDASTGLLGAWLGGPLYAGQQTPPTGAATVTATDGQTILGVDFPLQRGARISGIVQGESWPLPGARLKAINAEYETTRWTVTDDLGQYDLACLLPGTYTLKVEADGFADEWWDGMNHQAEATAFALGFGEETTLNFNLAAGQSPALVEVISDPSGAEIYLDYWPTGTSTPAVINLGEVGNQDWAGYRLASHVITLKKVGSPRQPPQVVPAVEAETVEMHFDLVPAATGAVSVVTTPDGAEVYVDYADAIDGVTPITVGNLSPGSHTILLRKSGYLQPRPITAWVLENQTTAIDVPLVLDTATNRTMAQVQSVPQGIQIYVDYLPSGQVTDAVVDLMDPASHAGAGWHSASHTILLRHEGVPPMAARIVPEVAGNLPAMMIHLPIDTEGATDSSGDGIPDWLWEQYGYDPLNPPDVNAIADVSGMTFGNKLRAGLDPRDPNSTFKVANVEVTNGPDQIKTITFVFRTVPGRRYLVQARERLMEGSWITISNVITATDYETTFAAQSEPGMEHLYYRLLVLDLY